MVVENIAGYLYGVDMTRQEAINILLDHFSAGFVRTIEDALKQEQDEPVAYFNPQEGGFYWAKPTKVEAPITVNVEPLPLYTTPQGCAECGVGGGYALYCVACAEKYVKPEWVGLTNNELVDLTIKNAGFPILLAQAIEAKLKQKNNIRVND